MCSNDRFERQARGEKSINDRREFLRWIKKAGVIYTCLHSSKATLANVVWWYINTRCMSISYYKSRSFPRYSIARSASTLDLSSSEEKDDKRFADYVAGETTGNCSKSCGRGKDCKSRHSLTIRYVQSATIV